MTDKSKTGKNNRRKGHNFERRIVKKYKECGFTEAVTTRYASRELDDKGIDIARVGEWEPQCKNMKNLSGSKMLDLLKNCNVIHYWNTDKRKGCVILGEEEFFNLIKNNSSSK